MKDLRTVNDYPPSGNRSFINQTIAVTLDYSHWAVNDQLPIYVDATNQSKSFSLQLLSMDLAHFKIHLNLHLHKATSL